MKLDKLTEATMLALRGKLNEVKGSSKTYTCIEDRQGGDFAVGKTMTAEEWGEEAYSWAYGDDWTDPEEPLLKNFKTEKECLDFIQDMWEITIVPSDSPEAKEFLGEARSHKECDNKTHQICRGIKNKQNKKVTEAIDEENSLDDIANYIKGIVGYNVTITPTGNGFSSYDVNFLNNDDSIMYSVAVNNDTIKDKVGLLNTLVLELNRLYRGKTFADIIRGKLLDELNKIHPVNKKVAEAIANLNNSTEE